MWHSHITVWVYPAKGVTARKGAVNREDHHEMAESSRTTISMRKLKFLLEKAIVTWEYRDCYLGNNLLESFMSFSFKDCPPWNTQPEGA